MVNKITDFINHIKINKFANIYSAGNNFFGKGKINNIGLKLTVPELLDLPPAKRNLASNIVREKTGYSIESSDDVFNNIMLIKDVQSRVQEDLTPDFKQQQWNYK